jgi:hypothetical protein
VHPAGSKRGRCRLRQPRWPQRRRRVSLS